MTPCRQITLVWTLCLMLSGISPGTVRAAPADIPGLVATMVSPEVTYEQRMAAWTSLSHQPSEAVLSALVPQLWLTIAPGLENHIHDRQQPEPTQTTSVQIFNAVRTQWWGHIVATEPVPEVGRLLVAQVNERRSPRVLIFVYTMWGNKLWVPEAGAAFTRLAHDPTQARQVRGSSALMVLNYERENGFITARAVIPNLPEPDLESQLSKAKSISQIFYMALRNPKYRFEDRDHLIRETFRLLEVAGQQRPTEMYPVVERVGAILGQKLVPDGKPDYPAMVANALQWWEKNKF